MSYARLKPRLLFSLTRRSLQQGPRRLMPVRAQSSDSAPPRGVAAVAAEPDTDASASAGASAKLSLTFTCTADACGARSTHSFSRLAYERGIVLVQCPACKNRHLIADHLGWFKESTEDGKLRTVEDLLRARGEKVRRGSVSQAGVFEYSH